MLFVIINPGLKGTPGTPGKLSPAVASIKSYSQELGIGRMDIGAKQLTPQLRRVVVGGNRIIGRNCC